MQAIALRPSLTERLFSVMNWDGCTPVMIRATVWCQFRNKRMPSQVRGAPALLDDMILTCGATGLVETRLLSTGILLNSRSAHTPIATSPVIASGRAICTFTDGRILAVDPRSLREAWSGSVSDGQVATPAITVEGDIGYFGADDLLQARDMQTGRVIWDLKGIPSAHRSFSRQWRGICDMQRKNRRVGRRNKSRAVEYRDGRVLARTTASSSYSCHSEWLPLLSPGLHNGGLQPKRGQLATVGF